jgi:hypothetical protein
MLPIKSQDSNEIPLVVGVIGGNEHIFAQLAAIVPSDVALLSQSDLAKYPLGHNLLTMTFLESFWLAILFKVELILMRY